LICSKLTDFYINIPDNIKQWWRRGVDDGGGVVVVTTGRLITWRTSTEILLSELLLHPKSRSSLLRAGGPLHIYIYIHTHTHTIYAYIYTYSTQNTKHHADGHFKLSSVNDFHNSSGRGLIAGVHRGKKQNRVCSIIAIIVIVTCAGCPTAYSASVYISVVLDYYFIIEWLFALYTCKNTNLKAR